MTCSLDPVRFSIRIELCLAKATSLWIIPRTVEKDWWAAVQIELCLNIKSWISPTDHGLLQDVLWILVLFFLLTQDLLPVQALEDVLHLQTKVRTGLHLPRLMSLAFPFLHTWTRPSLSVLLLLLLLSLNGRPVVERSDRSTELVALNVRFKGVSIQTTWNGV